MSRPEEPCFLYRLLDAEGTTIYIGMTVRVKTRMSEHRCARYKGTNPFATEIAAEMASYEVLAKFPSRTLAHLAEVAFIEHLRPRFNFNHNPDFAKPARRAAA